MAPVSLTLEKIDARTLLIIAHSPLVDHPQRLAVARTNLDSSRSSLEIARESLLRARERHVDYPSVASEEAVRKAQTGLEAARHVRHLTKEELLSRKLARQFSLSFPLSLN